MKIVCPHCSFAREVPDAQIPDRPVKVTCPKCEQGFSFNKAAAVAASAFDADFGEPESGSGAATAAPTPDLTSCPACGLEQPAGDACSGCGVIYAKWAARHDARGEAGSSDHQPQPDAAFPGRDAYAAVASVADLPKAGFWIRFVAYLIDAVILGAVQFTIGLALGVAGGALTDNGGEMAMAMISGLCGMVIGIAYAVFFTGYNGQTPGKMALRIQVVRNDSTPMSYGRAFLREVVGKFVSGIILGIGYIMVGFDRQKQGLHDKIAGTYVIKL